MSAPVSRAVPPTGAWWHLYPLGFLGAPSSSGGAQMLVEHRLPRLLPWWDYAADLGVEGVVLGPVFASETHGYDTVDYLRIDPRLGDEADLGALVEAAHDRGLRVVLDGVFNHVGRSFPRFQQALSQGPSSEAAQWFDLDWSSEPPVARTFEGHQHLVALNHAHPQVAEHVAEVLTLWCDRGVDGWRMDAAYAVPPRFWAPVLERLRRDHPDAWVFGEVIRGDYGSLVTASGLDSVTQYELWKAIGSAIVERNLFELAHALGRHADMLESFVPVTFLGNHDTTRIASTIDDPRHLPHAVVTLLGVGGTPTIYAGDEQGYTGVKYERLGGDDEVRPPFPEHPDQLSDLGRPLFELHRDLIRLRRERPWLATSRTEVDQLSNDTALLLTGEPGRRLGVALHLGDAEAALRLPSSANLLLGTGRLEADSLHLPPHGWAVLELL